MRDEQSTHTLTIRDMCDAYGVTPRTLRFYEDKALLQPQRNGQHRLYSRRDQARLKLILQGKRFGFSLQEIRELLDLYDLDDQQHTQLTKTLQIGEERLAKMKDQQRELASAVTDLEAQLDHVAALIAQNQHLSLAMKDT